MLTLKKVFERLYVEYYSLILKSSKVAFAIFFLCIMSNAQGNGNTFSNTSDLVEGENQIPDSDNNGFSGIYISEGTIISGSENIYSELKIVRVQAKKNNDSKNKNIEEVLTEISGSSSELKHTHTQMAVKEKSEDKPLHEAKYRPVFPKSSFAFDSYDATAAIAPTVFQVLTSLVQNNDLNVIPDWIREELKPDFQFKITSQIYKETFFVRPPPSLG